ncbi:lactonase family protein [Microbacterium sp. HA-8]|uniref:lactonase family protein n=1 Tax=Microbacterium sp. HA-8 TaxID=3234200 RepID=UPI0038F718B5
MQFWVGGWGPEMDSAAEGVGALAAGGLDGASAGGPLAFVGTVARAASPSWLAAHPSLDVVYATLESEGRLQAYRRSGRSSLAPLGRAVEVGDAVCHAAVSSDGAFLVASCWGDGRVVRIGLDAVGRPVSRVEAAAAVDPHAGSGSGSGWGSGAGAGVGAGAGPASAGADAATAVAVAGAGVGAGAGPAGAGSPWAGAGGVDLAAAARALREATGAEFAHLVPDHDREDPGAVAPASTVEGEPAEAPVRVSRAHAAAFLHCGRIATTDLGFDLVRIWRVDAAGLRADHEVVLPQGCGPRHMIVHPSGHLYVVTEFSCEVFVLAPDASGRWGLVGGMPAPVGYLAGDTGAEIALSRDAEFVYTGLRGSNTIAVARVRGQGETLAPVALVESGVDWPRHHLVVRDTMLVAGQRSNDVVSFSLDIRTGVPGRVRHRAAVPAPTRLLPARP